MWVTTFAWNLFWWVSLCISSLLLFRLGFEKGPAALALFGMLLLTLFNFGVLKTLIVAWVHLPSMAGFESIGLPYMRAFIPVTPCTLLSAYLALQIQASRKPSVMSWVLMGALQSAALGLFPYATLMMAGISVVSAAWTVFYGGNRRTWTLMVVYGISCAIADGIFTMRGSLSFYSPHSSFLHFQPSLLPHLIGGNWCILGVLVVGILLGKNLGSEVKWPLVGLGLTNMVLMLGDAFVPATTILLSHHAAHFLHFTISILLMSVMYELLRRFRNRRRWIGVGIAIAASIVVANGALLAAGTYRALSLYNREEVNLTRLLQGTWKPKEGDLIVARSHNVDDPCSWIPVLAAQPVLFCTDAEVMLTPQQNLEVHRFRQAIYLYLTGRDSVSLDKVLAGPNAKDLRYELGYWAEAVSWSPEEQAQAFKQSVRNCCHICAT